jgi:hypothetical protein
MGELINREPRYGTMIFWSPGQGHLPLAVCRQRGARPEKVILSGRDRLELLISAHNMAEGVPGVPVVTESLPSPGVPGGPGDRESADLLVSDINPIPRSDWADPMKAAAMHLVKPGGIWGIVGRSADVAVLTKFSKGWSMLEDKRTRGWRALVYRKNSQY